MPVQSDNGLRWVCSLHRAPISLHEYLQHYNPDGKKETAKASDEGTAIYLLSEGLHTSQKLLVSICSGSAVGPHRSNFPARLLNINGA
jgi:hypothetical protein